MTNRNRFWQALDEWPTLAAVAEEWQRYCGSEWSSVLPLMRPRPDLATTYPNTRGELPYEVIHHSAEQIVGVCPDSGETISLNRTQLVVHELNRRLLAARVTEAFGIEAEESTGQPSERTHFLGCWGIDLRQQFRCFLGLPWASADIQVLSAHLIANQQTPFLLFAPTRRWYRRSHESLLKFQSCVFLPLCELLTVECSGKLRATSSLETVLEPILRQLPVLPSQRCIHVSQNIVRHEKPDWKVTYAEQTVTVPHNLGIQYLARLLAAPKQNISAVQLKQALNPDVLLQPSRGIEVADAAARQQYRAEYDSLSAELEEARRNDDVGRVERMQEELAHLVSLTQQAQGLGHRGRRVKDETDTIRTSVRNAIARTIDQVESKHPALAQHWRDYLSFGHELCYNAPQGVRWEVSF